MMMHGAPKWFALLAAIGAGILGMQASAGAGALAQQLVGTWTSAGSEAAPDGSQPPHEPAKGILVFTRDGRFAQIQVVPSDSKAGSLSRVQGGADASGAGRKASVAAFGTYTVNEETGLVTCHIQSSTMPNWDGIDQQRWIVFLTADELRLGSPDGWAQQSAMTDVWRRAAKDGVAVVAVPGSDTAR